MTKKKLLNILCLVALGMVFILYFYAAFQKGIWYKNQFLYCVNENEWSGTVYTDTLTIRREKMDNKVFLYFIKNYSHSGTLLFSSVINFRK